ncbi:DUF2254 family protein [Sphingomonas sp. PB1R3]|uniref:DUF2254 family protein n=1 Tax=Sphingomonas flavida TaxID=3096154 RepID=UPI002FCA0CC2
MTGTGWDGRARPAPKPVRSPRRAVRATIERLHRSMFEFIAAPALIVCGFVVLAEVIDWLDNHAGPQRSWSPLRTWLAQYVGDTQSAIGVLTAIAGSLFTVTSITFSILILAVQQGATVLNSQIVDHYLRRASNRAWFGFFVGISLFALITLVQTTHTRAPIFGVMMSTILGAVALFALIVLIYGTIDQMRPATLIAAIVDTAVAARNRQLPLLAASGPCVVEGGHIVHADHSGHVARVDVRALEELLAKHGDLRIAIRPAIGDFVTIGDPLAVMSAGHDALADMVAAAVVLTQKRDIADDAGYSLHHLHTIGWTAISTARSDPAVGAIAIQALHDLIVTWRDDPVRADGGGEGRARLGYDDRLPRQLIDTIESLMVAASESRQHQTMALLLDTVTAVLPIVSPSQRRDLPGALRTAALLAASHTPTRVMVHALARYSAACQRHGLEDVAAELAGALTPDQRKTNEDSHGTILP